MPDVPDLTDVRFVKRIVVGTHDPETRRSEPDHEAAIALLNRCLGDQPRGRIIGMERAFSLLAIADHQVVLQSVTYHVGFTRRPVWLDE